MFQPAAALFDGNPAKRFDGFVGGCETFELESCVLLVVVRGLKETSGGSVLNGSREILVEKSSG